MKVALVYDWLNVKIGGGETTFIDICDLYPDADIYCLVYNKDKFEKFFTNRAISTSRLQKLPKFIKKRPYFMLPFIKKSVDKLNFSGYDMVISVSSAWVKNIKVPKSSVHICYCYSPARMIWDSWPSYLNTQKLGPFKLGAISKFIVTRMVSKIRLWDYYNTSNVDHFIAISHYITKRISKFYNRDSQIVYPPVVLGKKPFQKINKRSYFLILSSLSRYKNIDSAIRACMQNKVDLLVVGEGPDKPRLENIANNSKYIKFTGRVNETKKWEYYKNAKAMIFPSIEDFGIAPVEAMSVGTPVIAYRGGGLSETVIDNISGIFYNNYDELQKIIQNFDNYTFSAENISETTKNYSLENFKKNFTQKVEYLYELGKKNDKE